MRDEIGRQHPAEGVFIFRGQATIVFLTVCTQKRETGLANPLVEQALVASWQLADAWLVGALFNYARSHSSLLLSAERELHN
jgi:hypothetical protein